MGREPGMFVYKKSGIFFLRFASELNKVFTRILDEFFRCSGLSNTSVFRWTVQNIMNLTPPPCIFSHIKVSLMVIINIKVYKRINFTRDH